MRFAAKFFFYDKKGPEGRNVIAPTVRSGYKSVNNN